MAVVPPEPTWTELLDERTPHLVKELVPAKLLPHLNLTASDREKIMCDERCEGQRHASLSLLEKLKKRNGGNGKQTFDRLVRALRNEGLQQSALLLDPHFKGICDNNKWQTTIHVPRIRKMLRFSVYFSTQQKFEILRMRTLV